MGKNDAVNSSNFLLNLGETLRRQAVAPIVSDAYSIKHLINNYRIDDRGCWIHKNKPMKSGYVQLATVDRKKYLAHRLSYALYKGDIPEGLNVCHACDVPNCVNPDHLFLGTQADNMKDKDNKNRHGRTGVQPLTEDEENFILAYRSMGKSYREIGVLMDIHPGTVGRYARGERTNG